MSLFGPFKGDNMNDIFNLFTPDLAFENNLDTETATRITKWLVNEGVLDYDVLKEVYNEPTVTINDNEQSVGA